MPWSHWQVSKETKQNFKYYFRSLRERGKWDWFSFKWLESALHGLVFAASFWGLCLPLKRCHLDSKAELNQEFKGTKKERGALLQQLSACVSPSYSREQLCPGPHVSPWESRLRINRKKKWLLWFQKSNLIPLWKVMAFVVFAKG